MEHPNLGMSALKALGIESLPVDRLQIVIEPDEKIRVIVSVIPDFDQRNKLQDWLKREVSEYRLVPIEKETN